MLLHYALDEVLAMICGVHCTEWAAGDAISCELQEDDWTVEQGHGKVVIRSKKPNERVDMTITLKRGSPSVAALSAVAQADYKTGLGAAPTTVKDLNGTALITAPRSFFLRRPLPGFASDLGDIEMTLVLVNPEFTPGTNRMA